MSLASFQRSLQPALQSALQAPESKPTELNVARPLDIGYIVHNRKLNSRMQLSR